MISCNSLTKQFGTLTAVNQVSFDLGAGEICAIPGPNGAGKSTLMAQRFRNQSSEASKHLILSTF